MLGQCKMEHTLSGGSKQVEEIFQQSGSLQTPAAPADSPFIKKVKEQACKMKMKKGGFKEGKKIVINGKTYDLDCAGQTR